MSVKYVKDFAFDPNFGFTGSDNRISVRPHMRRAAVTTPRTPEVTTSRTPISNRQKARQIMDRYIAGPRRAEPRGARRMPVVEPASMVDPREVPVYAKGGVVKKGAAKVAKVMGEFKRGELHSGSKSGPVVTNPKQAKAIALSEARKAGAKAPVKKAMGGRSCG